MSTSKKTDYHHGNLVVELKKRALKIITAKGVTHLSLRLLADQCGVSATAVYRHFKSKEHLLSEIALDGFADLQSQMLASSGPHKLQHIGMSYIHFALAHPVQFQLMFGGVIDKRKYPRLFKASQENFHVLRDQIEQYVKEGIMENNIDNLARTAWATVHGTALLLLDRQFASQNSDAMNSTQIALDITTILGKGLFIK